MFKAIILGSVLATAALAQDEDEAHRLDRLRTERLNRDAASAVNSRMRRNAGGERAYQAARAEYERRLAAWRRQVAACDAGQWSACQ